jgi:hypothetical protein
MPGRITLLEKKNEKKRRKKKKSCAGVRIGYYIRCMALCKFANKIIYLKNPEC